MSKNLTFNYGSLNCNSLVKSQSSTVQSSYIRFLGLQQLDIISLQETHASSSPIITTLDMQFKSKQSFWTPHCGIISFSPEYVLSHISTDEIFSSDRFLLCRVEHPHQFYTPFYILNLYAPASSNAERRSFFESLLELIYQLHDSIDIHRLIISGDFNYDYGRDIANGNHVNKTSMNWVEYLKTFFFNCMSHNDLDQLPTFQRNVHITSTIDYIFAGTYLEHLITDASVQFLNPQWSDHSLLQVTFNLGKSKTGPGLWRGNPAYANNTAFQQLLATNIRNASDKSTFATSYCDQWEVLKKVTKKTIKSFGVKYVSWRQASLRHLERKRNRLLRSKPPPATLVYFLPRLDSMISQLQQELVDISAYKAGVTWREKGERSAKYLKSIHQIRTSQQFMTGLKDTSTDPPLPMTSPLAAPLSTPTVTSHLNSMKTSTQRFYQSLYSKEHVLPSEITHYLDDIHFERQLSDTDRQALMAPITIDDIIEQASRHSNKVSSPGSDGLSYPFLVLLFQNPEVQDVIVAVYNQALAGIFPKSWQDIRVRLLPKKGDLWLLQNWRPISLINCDAKVFTRILSKRLGTVINKLLNPYQSGFIPGRFIGDNGFALSMVMEQARGFDSGGIGLLLDQEKAYDRVHPDYLAAVLERFGFPATWIHCIQSLFFGNQVSVNINGFFTDAILQERGLRQGDPLSPLLFNLALEPFLLSILQDSSITGFVCPSQNTVDISPSALATPSCELKLLAYADDICILLPTPTDFAAVQYRMHRYSIVSNAKFNEDKSEAFALNGKLDVKWSSVLLRNNISKYYHRGIATCMRYLGYYLPYTAQQRSQLESQMLQNVRSQCQLYSQRQLSIRGRVTIANTLILSKLWYTLRLLKPTKRFFDQIRSTIYQFVWQKKTPKLRKELIFHPLQAGGLMVQDPLIQHKLLQKRWLDYLFQPDVHPSFVYPLMLRHLSYCQHSQTFPLLPLYVKEYRKSPVISKDFSIWHILFQTFDYFSSSLDMELQDMPLQTVLQLPLYKLLQNIDDHHWTVRHPNFQAHLFFIFDNHAQRLRLKVNGEYTRYPNLCRRLFRDILRHRRIQIAPFVWTHILQPQSLHLIAWSQHSLVAMLKNAPSWKNFNTINFRQHFQSIVDFPLCFKTSIINTFWTFSTYPQARTIFYRVLSERIPTKQVLVKFGLVSSDRCSVCHTSAETFRHFLVDCPIKFEIWHRVLSQFYPHLFFTSDILFNSLRYLQHPDSMAHCPQYLTVLSITLWQIWNLHWKHGTDSTIPVSNSFIESITPRIVTHITTITRPPSGYN